MSNLPQSSIMAIFLHISYLLIRNILVKPINTTVFKFHALRYLLGILVISASACSNPNDETEVTVMADPGVAALSDTQSPMVGIEVNCHDGHRQRYWLETNYDVLRGKADEICDGRVSKETGKVGVNGFAIIFKGQESFYQPVLVGIEVDCYDGYKQTYMMKTSYDILQEKANEICKGRTSKESGKTGINGFSMIYSEQ